MSVIKEYTTSDQPPNNRAIFSFHTFHISTTCVSRHTKLKTGIFFFFSAATSVKAFRCFLKVKYTEMGIVS